MNDRLNKFMDTVCDAVRANYPHVQINYDYDVFKNTIEVIIEKNGKYVRLSFNNFDYDDTDTCFAVASHILHIINDKFVEEEEDE